MSFTSPVIGGHRGFKGKYPENSVFGFIKAFDAGVEVIETDLWLCTDLEIVITHDVNTKNNFIEEDGTPADYNILKSSYQDNLKHLRRKEIDEKMLTFPKLLEWFVAYEKDRQLADINSKQELSTLDPSSTTSSTSTVSRRIMLDIKFPNPPKILKRVIEELLKINDDLTFWEDKLQIGVWDLKFLKYMNQDPYFRKVFPDKQYFDILHITGNWKSSLAFLGYNEYADQLSKKDGIFRLKATGVSLLYLCTWSTDFVEKFMPLLKAQDLKMYQWTVNNKLQYDYLDKISRLYDIREYGLISDYPDKMLEYKRANELAVQQPITPVTFSFFQRFFHSIFYHFIGKKMPLAPPFDTPVNPDEIVLPNFSKVGMFIFRTCQKLGIF